MKLRVRAINLEHFQPLPLRISASYREEGLRKALPPTLFSRVTCLDVGELSEPTWELLKQFTALRHLTITDSIVPTHIGLSFPFLTKVALKYYDNSVAFSVVAALMSVAPRLERITLDLDDEVGDWLVPTLLEFFTKCQRAGVRKLRLAVPTSAVSPASLVQMLSFGAAHGGWIKVVLLLGPLKYYIGSPLDYREMHGC